jgi:hypothetical protein
VPKGKTGLINLAAQRLISQRTLAPKTAPIEMMSTSLKLRTIDFSYTNGQELSARLQAGGYGELHRRILFFITAWPRGKTLCRLLLAGR